MALIGKLKTWLRLRVLLNRVKKRLGMPSQALALEKLCSAGPRVDLIVDAGAAVGDFTALALSVWPNAAVLAIEPRPEPLGQLRRRFADYVKLHFFEGVLGDRSGATLQLKCAETASSVLEEHQALDVPTLAVASIRLDDLMAAQGLVAAQALLKIDVQGAELSVLLGARTTLRGCRAVLVEMSLIDIHREVPLAHEVIAFLATEGFVMFELSDLIRRPLDQALWQIEVLFVRQDDPLRSDKRWG